MNQNGLEALKVAGIIQDYLILSDNEMVIVPVKSADHIKLNLVISDEFKRTGGRL